MRTKEHRNLENYKAIEEEKIKIINNVFENLIAKSVPHDISRLVKGQTIGREPIAFVGSVLNQCIKCVYNSTEYMIPLTGNVSRAAKDAILESCFSREDFIEKYKVE